MYKTINVTEAIHARLKVYAAQHDTPLKVLVEDLIEEALFIREEQDRADAWAAEKVIRAERREEEDQ